MKNIIIFASFFISSLASASSGGPGAHTAADLQINPRAEKLQCDNIDASVTEWIKQVRAPLNVINQVAECSMNRHETFMVVIQDISIALADSASCSCAVEFDMSVAQCHGSNSGLIQLRQLTKDLDRFYGTALEEEFRGSASHNLEKARMPIYDLANQIVDFICPQLNK